MNRRSLIAAGFGCLSGPASASAVVRPQLRPPGGRVPFLFPQEQGVYVSCYVNDAPVLALLDSGATQSVIGEKLAERLGLKSAGSEILASQTRLLHAGVVPGISVSMGRDAAISISPACLDLAPLSGPSGLGPEVILGLDYMKSQIIDLDFTRRFIRLGRPTLDIENLEGIAVETGPFGACYCRVEVGGDRVEAMIDTANSAALAVSPSLLGVITAPGCPVSDALIVGADGPSVVKLFSAPEVMVGGIQILDVPTTSSAMWRSPFHAVIGLPLISRFRVGLALGEGRMTLANDADRQRAGFLRDLSGLGLEVLPDRLAIVHVATGSPAAAAGFKIGEEIVGIDGRRVNNQYDSGTLWRWRYDEGARSAVLTMASGDRRHIMLRRYY